MDRILSSCFPIEIANIIARKVHEMNMRGPLAQIKYCIVKIRIDEDGYTFIASNNHNYFIALLSEGFEAGWGSDESLSGEVEGE